MGRILIVEDNVSISQGLKKIAKSFDNNLEIITTGYSKEAYKCLCEKRIDAFFLDIQLLDYSGIELAKQIRSKKEYKLTPIVFITAVLTRELLAFKEIHCYDYIVKPFTEKEIKKIFKTIICDGIQEKEDKILKLKQKEFSYCLKQKDIIYIESVNRKIVVQTNNEKITLSTYTLNKLQKELDNSFVRCHRGFIVNTNYIHKVDLGSDLIRIKEIDCPIPIGRKYKDELRGRVI